MREATLWDDIRQPLVACRPHGLALEWPRCIMVHPLRSRYLRIGRVELRRHPQPAAEDPNVYLDRLAELAGILCGIPWLLAGGLSIPVTLGSFYRRHYDVDIAIALEDLPRVEAAMLDAGFYLSTCFPTSLFGRLRSALHIPVRADEPLVRRRPRKLKFRDAAGRRPPPNLLAEVEPLPFRLSAGKLHTFDGSHRIPVDRPLVGHRLRTPNGHEVSCLDLHYVAWLKQTRREPKDLVDLAVISGSLKAAVPGL